jgi:PAS domain S-box-containing protein
MENLSLLRAIFENTSDAVYAKDLDGRYLLVNQAATAVIGHSETEIIGRDDLALFPPDMARQFMETDRRIMDNGTTETVEETAIVAGEPRMFLSTKTAHRDAVGNVVGLIGISRDITERKRAEAYEHAQSARSAALAEFSLAVSQSNLDLDLLGSTIVRRVAELVGDCCVMRLLSEDRQILLPGYIYHTNPEMTVLLHNMLAVYPQRVDESMSGRVVVTGEPLFAPRLPIEQVRAATKPEFWPYLEQLGSPSITIVPLHNLGQILGTLMIVRNQTSEDLTRDDLVFAKDLADRAALAIANAQLFDAQQAARSAVETASERLIALAEASRVFASATLDLNKLLHTITHLVGNVVGNACSIRLISEDGAWLQPGVSYHPDPEMEEFLQRTHVEAPQRVDEGFSGQAIQAGQTVFVPFVSTEQFADNVKPEFRPLILRFQIQSGIFVPLRIQEQILGVLLVLRDRTTIPYTLEDKIFVEDLADRAALAIYNARLFQQARQAMQSKDEALALLDTLLARAPVGIGFVDHNMRFVRVNHALAHMNGQTIEQHLGYTLREALPDLAATLEPLYLQVLQSGEAISDIEISGEMPANPGRRRYWVASFYPVPLPDEQTLGVGVIVAETTEQKRLEAQLIQSQKMESVGRLAGGVAHDFNNLLTAISGYTELALDDLPEDSRVIGDLEEIRKAVARASALTRQLLAFARKQVIEPRILDLNSLVRDLEKLLRRLIGEDIDLVTHTAADLRAVKADAGQIEQLLVNLAVNARDAMPDGGNLTIETANVVLDGDYVRQHLGAASGEYVLLAVSDTGTGMTDEVKQHIFEPFFTTKAQGQGTGLGLATCYGIVNQHGGYIAAYSELGDGTTFKIYLPAVGGRAEAQPRELSRSEVMIGHETVLLVEDEPAVRQIAARVLREHGYIVIEAGDGEEALQLLAQAERPIDLLLTDVIMPKLHGGILAERALAIVPELRILFISGYTDGALVHRQKLQSSGAFLQKPFSPVALVRKVREVLDAKGEVGHL